MTSFMPTVVSGHIVPGKVDPLIRFSYVTNRHYGPPTNVRPRGPAPAQKPRDLGDERHQQLLGAIKNIGITQQATQITDALPGYRDWR